MPEVLKTILEEAARAPQVDYLAEALRIQEELKKTGIEFSDSAELIREARDG